MTLLGSSAKTQNQFVVDPGKFSTEDSNGNISNIDNR